MNKMPGQNKVVRHDEKHTGKGFQKEMPGAWPKVPS